MTRSRIPTQAELDTALWLDGHAAIEVAEAAHGAPGWPPLLRMAVAASVVSGSPRIDAVDIAAAQRDRDVDWPLDGYMYPVPRARVESSLIRYRAGYSPWNGSRDAEWVDSVELVSAALRGESEPLRRVAIELAAADRRAVAS